MTVAREEESWTMRRCPDCGSLSTAANCGLDRVPTEPIEVVPASERDQLRQALEAVMDNTLPLLPLQGSSGSYRISDKIDSPLVATAEEWANAAFAWVEAQQALHPEPES